MKALKLIGYFLLFFLILFALTYSMAAFISWESNPGKWSENARAGIVFLLYVNIMISGGLAGHFTFKDEQN